MTNINPTELEKMKSKSDYYEAEYNNLKSQLTKQKKENDKLTARLNKQGEMLEETEFDNNNMKKSLYIIVNALNELEEKEFSNTILSKSLTDIFNSVLSGIHSRQIESIFDIDDIIDGYVEAKGYREAESNRSCDCSVCTNKISEENIMSLINFFEAEVFSTDEFQRIVNAILKEEEKNEDTH